MRRGAVARAACGTENTPCPGLGWYLSAANETRRFLWTLAHPHGVLLGVLNVAYALSLKLYQLRSPRLPVASVLLALGSLMLPAGFLLGGIVIHGGDPNAFIALSPIGGGLLAVAVPIAAYDFIGAARDRGTA